MVCLGMMKRNRKSRRGFDLPPCLFSKKTKKKNVRNATDCFKMLPLTFCLCVCILFLTLRIPSLILVILFSAPLAASHFHFFLMRLLCLHEQNINSLFPSPSSSLFQGTTPRFPALLSKLLTASASFITPFTRGASRSFKDAKMRNTVSYTVFFSLGGTSAGGNQNKQVMGNTFFCKL